MAFRLQSVILSTHQIDYNPGSDALHSAGLSRLLYDAYPLTNHLDLMVSA